MGQQIDVQPDDLAAIGDISHVDRHAASIDHDAAAFGGRRTQRNLQQIGRLYARAADYDRLVGMLNLDVGEAREDCQRRAGQKRFRIAIEHRAARCRSHDAVGLTVLVLQAPDEAVFRSASAATLVQLGKRRRVIDLDTFGDVVLDRVDQNGPVGCELEPMPARSASAANVPRP